jgi:hypothetical protein
VRQNWPAIVVEFTLVLIVALLCLEPILTLAGAADDQVVEIDPVTGWSPMVNRSFAWRGEWYCRSAFNSMGLRGPERSFAKPANTLRIVVVGSSLTASLQVPNEKTYCSILEKELNKPSEKQKAEKQKVEVLNLGVDGYNVGQEFLRLENFGFNFHPDLVVLEARPEVIISQLKGVELLGPPPEFDLQSDGQLILDRHRQLEWRHSPLGKAAIAAGWLRFHSRLWGVVGICAEQLAGIPDQLRTWQRHFVRPFGRHPHGRTDLKQPRGTTLAQAPDGSPYDIIYGGKLLEALIKKTNEECLRRGCRFMLVYLPDLRRKADPREALILRQAASNLSIDYLDLNPVFKRLDERPHPPFKFRVHFTEEGHRIAGDQLAAFIEQKKLLQ